MKFKWKKRSDTCYELEVGNFLGCVELAGEDAFRNSIVDASAIQKKPLRMLPLGNYGISFPSFEAAKQAVERAIIKAKEATA